VELEEEIVNATFEHRFPFVMAAIVLFCVLLSVMALAVGCLGDEYGSPPWDQAGVMRQ
jgi:hypothetical protein